MRKKGGYSLVKVVAISAILGVLTALFVSGGIAQRQKGEETSIKMLTTLGFSDIRVIGYELGTSRLGDDEYTYSCKAINASGKPVKVNAVWSERLGVKINNPVLYSTFVVKGIKNIKL